MRKPHRRRPDAFRANGMRAELHQPGPRAAALGRIPDRTARLRRAPRLDDERRPGSALDGRHVEAHQQRQPLPVVPAVPPRRRVGDARAGVAAEIADAQLRDAVGQHRALGVAELGLLQRREIGNGALLHELRFLPGAHDGEPEIIDAALGHPLGQRRGVTHLVALAGEQQRQLGRLPQPLRILRGNLRAQIRLRGPHVRNLPDLRLAAVPAARREGKRAEENRRHARHEHERDHELDEREAAGAKARRRHLTSRAPMRVVASA